jgi:aspartate racemase
MSPPSTLILTMQATTDAAAFRGTLGVLGGMGPLSSAEFVRTIYEHARGAREQEDPAVLLYSDPSFPDRTEAFLAGAEERVAVPLEAALRRLVQMGAARLVVCCMTAHHVFPRLPQELRARLVSLVDVTIGELERTPGRHLLVCSSGSRALRIFERHPAWPRVADRVLLPDPDEQTALHRDIIYRAKRNVDARELLPVLASALERHGVTSFVAGCSEVHLLAKRFLALPEGAGYSCVDPFDLLARRVAHAGAGAAAPLAPV